MRVTAAIVVGQIVAGRSLNEVLREYPHLERDDVLRALGDAGDSPKDGKGC